MQRTDPGGSLQQRPSSFTPSDRPESNRRDRPAGSLPCLCRVLAVSLLGDFQRPVRFRRPRSRRQRTCDQRIGPVGPAVKFGADRPLARYRTSTHPSLSVYCRDTRHPQITHTSPAHHPQRSFPAGWTRRAPNRAARHCHHPHPETAPWPLRGRRDTRSRLSTRHYSLPRRAAEGKVWLGRASRCRDRSVVLFSPPAKLGHGLVVCPPPTETGGESPAGQAGTGEHSFRVRDAAG